MECFGHFQLTSHRRTTAINAQGHKTLQSTFLNKSIPMHSFPGETCKQRQVLLKTFFVDFPNAKIFFAIGQFPSAFSFCSLRIDGKTKKEINSGKSLSLRTEFLQSPSFRLQSYSLLNHVLPKYLQGDHKPGQDHKRGLAKYTSLATTRQKFSGKLKVCWISLAVSPTTISTHTAPGPERDSLEKHGQKDVCLPSSNDVCCFFSFLEDFFISHLQRLIFL